MNRGRHGNQGTTTGSRRSTASRVSPGLLHAGAAAQVVGAFGRDPQFAQFYRSLEAYKASFAKKSDIMVLDPASSDFFKTMRGAGSSAAPARK